MDTDLDEVANPCPRCGVSRPSLEATCSDCEWSPAPVRTASLERAQITFEMLSEALRTSSISSLFLIMTLAGVSVAIFAANWIVGLLLAPVVTIALARTALFVAYAKADGVRLSSMQKAVAFLQACCLVFAIILASCCAFVLTCLPATIVSQSLPFGMSIGGLISATLTILILTRVSVYRERPVT